MIGEVYLSNDRTCTVQRHPQTTIVNACVRLRAVKPHVVFGNSPSVVNDFGVFANERFVIDDKAALKGQQIAEIRP
jgi:hypothetical protein